MLRRLIKSTGMPASLASITRSFASKKVDMVNLKIDGKDVSVPKGTLLVEAVRMAGSTVPTMCYHPDVSSSGGICRICLVESEQRPGVPIISCKTQAQEGMNINTKGQKTREYRQANTAMMFTGHPNSCNTCPSSTRCKGQSLAASINIAQCAVDGIVPPNQSGIMDKTTAIHRDKDRCINCDICVQTCKMQGVGALAFYNEGGHQVESLGTLDVSECIQCGQCINRCPTGALSEMPEIEQVLDAIADKKKTVVFQMAPAIRAAIAEEFGCKAGEKIMKNEIVTALKMLGPNVVVMDTDFTADLTIIEEGYELIERLYRTVTGKKSLGPDHMNTELPLFTSCCPGWVMFMEKNYPEMLNHMSSTKSPMQMLGALSKSYWAKEVAKIDPSNIVNVAIMPCTAKKQEKDREDMRMENGQKWMDHVLTTRELAKLLRQSNINPAKLEKTPFDKIMGESTGAAVIFGATGGVMEAALRTAYEVITGREVPFKNLNIEPCRGMEGIREASVKFENVVEKYKPFEGFTLKIAVAHGPANARKLVEIVKQAKLAGQPAPWHFIEIMACPGGCIGGGGQPKPTDMEVRKQRTKLIYQEDMDLPLRKSHENPEVKEIYEKFLKEPLGHNSHHLLHREYTAKPVRDMSAYNASEAAGLDDILVKYPKEQQYFLPIIIEEHDKKGYISDPSLVKIAKHIGMYPSQADSILSSYHYFPRTKTSDTHVYFCTCHNCMMKGQRKVMEEIEKVFGVPCCKGGVSKDGKYTFHKLNWLGWCVNDAPSAMIKRTGTDHIEVLSGFCEKSIEETIRNFSERAEIRSKTPKNKIITTPFKDSELSFLTTPVDLPSIVHKAVKMKTKKVIKEITESGLVGRGGAGFKTGLKWKSAADVESSEKYVVCNADEGLPSTYKDWCILSDEKKRKEVIAGMGICAKTIGAKKCYIYLRYEYRNLVPELKAAIDEVQKTCEDMADLNFEVRLGGGPYVAGEENAQFESIMGAAPIPRKDRPSNVFPTMAGLFHKPTVINNVETFWSVPHIIQEGAKKFAKNGLPKLLSVTGDVSSPVLLETNLRDYSLNQLITDIKAEDIVAAEVGGCTEPIIFREKFGTNFGFGQGVLNAVGSCVLFNSKRDILDVYEDKLHFMADESCKQCVPCRDGSKLFYQSFHDYRHCNRKPKEKSLMMAAESAGATSICAHGKALHPLYKEAWSYLVKHAKDK